MQTGTPKRQAALQRQEWAVTLVVKVLPVQVVSEMEHILVPLLKHSLVGQHDRERQALDVRRSHV